MINCIIFDLGDVLVKNNPGRVCKRLVKTCSRQHRETLWFAPEKVRKRLDKGKLSGREIYRYAVKNLKLKGVPYKRFMRVFPDIFTDNKPVQNLARKLSKNYRLVLLSNTNAMHFNHIKRKFPILKVFSSFALSYKLGHVKPQPEIYRAAVKKSGFTAKECVFIDNEKSNIAGARKAGLNALHYTSDAKLKRELKQLGVRF